MNQILVSSIIMIILDTVYIGLVAKNLYNNLVPSIQKRALSIEPVYAAITYILMVTAVNTFSITCDPKESARLGFILGIVVYGVYSFTNMTIFDEYNLFVAVTDTLWGGFLFATVSFITSQVTDSDCFRSNITNPASW